jgi:hypothetical protein
LFASEEKPVPPARKVSTEFPEGRNGACAVPASSLVISKTEVL